MDKPKFTPGPWRCNDENGKWLAGETEWHADFQGDSIAGVESAVPILSHDGTTVAIAVYENKSFDGDDDDELKANARLISAAPDLYAACEDLLNHVSIASVERARAALAKAKGE